MKVILPLLQKPPIDRRPQLQIPLAPPAWYIWEMERERLQQTPSHPDSPLEENERGVIIIET